MHAIDLAFAGHEELVAYVLRDQEGYYEDEHVHVAIRDGVHWPTERLRRGATIGLGRSLSRMTDDIGWTVLSVNTHRPLFWFLGGPEVASMTDLAAAVGGACRPHPHRLLRPNSAAPAQLGPRCGRGRCMAGV